MESIIFLGLIALVGGSAWARRKRVITLVAPEKHPAEHPYATPPEKFMVWPADARTSAAPKGRARTTALHDAIEKSETME